MDTRAGIISYDELASAAEIGVNLALDDRAGAAIATTDPVIRTGTCTTGYHPPDPTSGALRLDPSTTTGMYPPDPVAKIGTTTTFYAAS